jgi:hypothetical protein
MLLNVVKIIEPEAEFFHNQKPLGRIKWKKLRYSQNVAFPRYQVAMASSLARNLPIKKKRYFGKIGRAKKNASLAVSGVTSQSSNTSDRIKGVQLTLSQDAVPMLDAVQPDQLRNARSERPSTIVLTFADGFTGRLTLSQMGINANEVRLSTAKVVENGLEFKATAKGVGKLVIDSPTLRYIADPAYAATLDSAISRMLPSEELERIAEKHQPPQSWYVHNKEDA